LMKASVQWYIHIGSDAVYGKSPNFPVIGGPLTLIRARKIEDVLASMEPGGTVLRIGKFVTGLNWERKTKILTNRKGDEVWYKDLS